MLTAGRLHVAWSAPVVLAALLLSGCSIHPAPRVEPLLDAREFSTAVKLHGTWLQLHVSAPRATMSNGADTAKGADGVVVLWASGDGGWFGPSVDMFRQIGNAGYLAVGFSSRAFLRIERPRGSLVTPAQLAAEYELILTQVRSALGLAPTSRTVLAGFSRGAAFSVLVGSEPVAADRILGVVALGLPDGKDLDIKDLEEGGRMPTDTYARIARLDPLPCAVIQSTHDKYLPAPKARQMFGPDTAQRRFYAIDASNHRFSGGKTALSTAFLDAIRWVVSPP